MNRQKESALSPHPRHSVTALLLLLPLPSLGGAAGMWWWPDSLQGKLFYGLSKVLLLGFPLFWHVYVDRGIMHRPCLSRRGLRAGLLSGGLLSILIVLGSIPAFTFWVDAGAIRQELTALGFARPFFFLLMALYWSTVNAVLEEYVWRWFFLRQLQALLLNPRAALILSAAGFTLHHLIVVSAWLPISSTLLVNSGICCAGLHWSSLTLRHQSLLPAFISHIMADLAIVAVGAWVLFFA